MRSSHQGSGTSMRATGHAMAAANALRSGSGQRHSVAQARTGKSTVIGQGQIPNQATSNQPTNAKGTERRSSVGLQNTEQPSSQNPATARRPSSAGFISDGAKALDTIKNDIREIQTALSRAHEVPASVRKLLGQGDDNGRPSTVHAATRRSTVSVSSAGRPSTADGPASPLEAKAIQDANDLESRLQRYTFSQDALQVMTARAGLWDILSSKSSEVIRRLLAQTDIHLEELRKVAKDKELEDHVCSTGSTFATTFLRAAERIKTLDGLLHYHSRTTQSVHSELSVSKSKCKSLAEEVDLLRGALMEASQGKHRGLQMNGAKPSAKPRAATASAGCQTSPRAAGGAAGSDDELRARVLDLEAANAALTQELADTNKALKEVEATNAEWKRRASESPQPAPGTPASPSARSPGAAGSGPRTPASAGKPPATPRAKVASSAAQTEPLDDAEARKLRTLVKTLQTENKGLTGKIQDLRKGEQDVSTKTRDVHARAEAAEASAARLQSKVAELEASLKPLGEQAKRGAAAEREFASLKEQLKRLADSTKASSTTAVSTQTTDSGESIQSLRDELAQAQAAVTTITTKYTAREMEYEQRLQGLQQKALTMSARVAELDQLRRSTEDNLRSEHAAATKELRGQMSEAEGRASRGEEAAAGLREQLDKAQQLHKRELEVLQAELSSCRAPGQALTDLEAEREAVRRQQEEVEGLRRELEAEAKTVKSMNVLSKSGTMKFDLPATHSKRPSSQGDMEGGGGDRGAVQRLQKQLKEVHGKYNEVQKAMLGKQAAIDSLQHELQLLRQVQHRSDTMSKEQEGLILLLQSRIKLLEQQNSHIAEIERSSRKGVGMQRPSSAAPYRAGGAARMGGPPILFRADNRAMQAHASHQNPQSHSEHPSNGAPPTCKDSVTPKSRPQSGRQTLLLL